MFWKLATIKMHRFARIITEPVEKEPIEHIYQSLGIGNHSVDCTVLKPSCAVSEGEMGSGLLPPPAPWKSQSNTSPAPLKNHKATKPAFNVGPSGPPPPKKNIWFLSNTGPVSLKDHKATKLAFNVAPSSARHSNGVSLAARWWPV